MPFEDAIRRTVTNAAILTSGHESRLPAVVRQRPRGNPSAEEFTRQAEDSARQRFSRRHSDRLGNEANEGLGQRPSRRTVGNVTWIRERRGTDEVHTHDRRQVTDRRGSGVANLGQRAMDRAPGLTTVGSGFMAQLIAQEIVPEISNNDGGLMTDGGVEAYEDSLARAEQHIDPFYAYFERA